MQLQQSVKVFRLSVSRVLLQTIVRLVLDMVTLARCYLKKKQNASAFLAGHESFAAAEGAIGIAEKANKVRQKPLRVILNGLGKDAAQIISRINGFTFVETQYDYKASKVKRCIRKGILRRSSCILLSATVQMMFRKVLQSCITRT